MAKLLKRLNHNLVILSLLLILGFFLRVVNIDNIPKGIYGDGLTAVYDAYSILNTGHDQKGNFLPFVFELGDHRPPGYVYATIPFVAILGPGALAANSLSILSGIGLIIMMYLLGKKLYSPRVGIIAAFLMTFSAWDLDLSRGPFETHFALFLVVLGVFCYLQIKQNSWWLILTSLCFGLSSLTYPTYVLTAPLLLLFIVILDKDKFEYFKRNKTLTITAGMISLIVVILSFLIIHSGKGPSRAESLNVFNKPETQATVTEHINSDRQFESGPEWSKYLLHNKFLSYSLLITDYYLQNFRPDFLLLRGDPQPRHNPDETGQINIATGILVILGVVFLYRKRILALFLGWLLIAPIATALIGPPHALRDSLMLPPLMLLAAFGAEKVFHSHNRYKTLIIFIIIGLYILEQIYFLDRFYFIAPNKFARYWSYSAKHASQITLREKSNYNYIFLSPRIDNMEFAYPVYAKLEPKDVIAQNQHGTMLNGYKFLNYGNVYIGTIPQEKTKEFLKSLPGSYLYLGPVEEKTFVEIKDVLPGPDFLPELVIAERK